MNINEILDYLNKEEIRCTYSAAAELLGTSPRSVGRYLGENRPEASWIVSVSTKKPTGYSKSDMHPNLYKHSKIITDADELRKNIKDFQTRKRTWI